MDGELAPKDFVGKWYYTFERDEVEHYENVFDSAAEALDAARLDPDSDDYSEVYIGIYVISNADMDDVSLAFTQDEICDEIDCILLNRENTLRIASHDALNIPEIPDEALERFHAEITRAFRRMITSCGIDQVVQRNPFATSMSLWGDEDQEEDDESLDVSSNLPGGDNRFRPVRRGRL